MLYILYKISRFRKVLLEMLTDMQSVWNTTDGDMKYVLVDCVESYVKLVQNRWFSVLWAMIVVLFSCFGCVFCIAMWFVSLNKVSKFFGIVSLSTAVKNSVSFLLLGYSKYLDEPRIQS